LYQRSCSPLFIMKQVFYFSEGVAGQIILRTCKETVRFEINS
jgi:hypothetical protein